MIVRIITLRTTSSSCFAAVMGDSGKLYVAADVIPVYRDLLHLADVITPNWFEVEYVYPHWLSMCPLTSLLGH